MLDATGSDELVHWAAYYEWRDKHERVQMARAIGLALGGDEPEPVVQASPDNPNPLNLPSRSG